MANIFDMSDAWNDGGTTFTAIKMDVTDTASASGSLLMDLQVGSTSQFSVSKGGLVRANDYYYTDAGFYIWSGTEATSRLLATSSGQFTIAGPTSYVGFAATNANLGADVILTRKGGRNLQLGPADAAALQDNAGQTLSVQSIANGTTLDAVGGDFTIQGSAGTGSGAGGSIIFQVAPAGGSGTGQNTLVDALTIGSNGSLSSPYGINLGHGSGTAGAGQIFFYVSAGSANALAMQNANGVFRVSDSGSFQFHSGSNVLSGSPDVILARDAANTLALRNGANAQAFNIYNTFTDATDFERGFLKWDTNVFTIGTDAGGSGGTARVTKILLGGNVNTFLSADNAGSSSRAVLSGQGAIEFATSGTTRVLFGNTNIIPASGLSIDLGAPSGFGWASLSIKERNADPSDPNEGHSVMWQSDGTGSGDDGDIMMKITAGGVTKTATIVDFSTI